MGTKIFVSNKVGTALRQIQVLLDIGHCLNRIQMLKILFPSHVGLVVPGLERELDKAKFK